MVCGFLLLNNPEEQTEKLKTVSQGFCVDTHQLLAFKHLDVIVAVYENWGNLESSRAPHSCSRSVDIYLLFTSGQISSAVGFALWRQPRSSERRQCQGCCSTAFLWWSIYIIVSVSRLQHFYESSAASCVRSTMCNCLFVQEHQQNTIKSLCNLCIFNCWARGSERTPDKEVWTEKCYICVDALGFRSYDKWTLNQLSRANF